MNLLSLMYGNKYLLNDILGKNNPIGPKVIAKFAIQIVKDEWFQKGLLN